MSRLHRGMLWLALVVVVAMTFFPSLFAALAGDGSDAISLDAPIVTLSIDGMDCEACAVSLQSSLRRVPGVTAASVSCDEGTAQVNVDELSPPLVDMLKNAVERSGFRASELDK